MYCGYGMYWNENEQKLKSKNPDAATCGCRVEEDEMSTDINQLRKHINRLPTNKDRYAMALFAVGATFGHLSEDETHSLIESVEDEVRRALGEEERWMP